MSLSVPSTSRLSPPKNDCDCSKLWLWLSLGAWICVWATPWENGSSEIQVQQRLLSVHIYWWKHLPYEWPQINRCAGWSEPSMVAYALHTFSHDTAHLFELILSQCMSRPKRRYVRSTEVQNSLGTNWTGPRWPSIFSSGRRANSLKGSELDPSFVGGIICLCALRYPCFFLDYWPFQHVFISFEKKLNELIALSTPVFALPSEYTGYILQIMHICIGIKIEQTLCCQICTLDFCWFIVYMVYFLWCSFFFKWLIAVRIVVRFFATSYR